jgi:hypothetical protein
MKIKKKKKSFLGWFENRKALGGSFLLLFLLSAPSSMEFYSFTQSTRKELIIESENG